MRGEPEDICCLPCSGTSKEPYAFVHFISSTNSGVLLLAKDSNIQNYYKVEIDLRLRNRFKQERALRWAEKQVAKAPIGADLLV